MVGHPKSGAACNYGVEGRGKGRSQVPQMRHAGAHLTTTSSSLNPILNMYVYSKNGAYAVGMQSGGPTGAGRSQGSRVVGGPEYIDIVRTLSVRPRPQDPSNQTYTTVTYRHDHIVRGHGNLNVPALVVLGPPGMRRTIRHGSIHTACTNNRSPHSRVGLTSLEARRGPCPRLENMTPLL